MPEKSQGGVVIAATVPAPGTAAIALTALAGWPADTHKAFRPRSSGSVALQVLEEFGAGDEIRTHDIYLGKVTLYP